jgi:CBS domain containing-hemolysin-like protein
MAWQLTVAVLLVLANGFFVAVEFAVARVRPTQAQEMLRAGKPGAKSVTHAVEHIDSYLSACQLGITLSSLGLGAIGEPAFHDLLEPVLGDAASIAGFGLASIVAFAIITTLHVVIGELAPKSLAISRTPKVVIALAPIMRAFYFLTRPVVDAFNAMGNLVLKPFGVPPASEAGHQPHSEDELRELLRQSSREGLIDPGEQEISEAALLFGDMRARDVMKPRPDIDYVLTTDEPESIARRAMDSGRTRLPVCDSERGLDAAIGVVNAKDLLLLLFHDAQAFDLSKTVRPIAHISESARVDEVLRDMREQRLHVGLVHDEHGTVVGLVTMEDILEELVGEIEDEFDERQAEHFHERDGNLEVDGQAPVRALADRLGCELDEHHETTVSGYLSEQLGRVPESGEVVQCHGWDIAIQAVEETRIVSLTVLGNSDQAPAGDRPGGNA